MAYSSVERIRHAPLGRSRTPRRPEWAQGVPRAYRGRGPRALHSIYDADHDDARSSGRFRWLVSTCLAAAVGALAIGVVIFGSLDTKEGREAFLPTLKGFGEGQLPSQPLLPEARPADGLHWTVAKTDRLPVAGEAATAKYLIHEKVQIKRNNRPFLQKRAYMRIVARLLPVSPAYASAVPPFNAVSLYAASGLAAEGGASGGESYGQVSVRVVELLGSVLPAEDGQELDAQEVGQLVARAVESEPEPASLRPSFLAEGADGAVGAGKAGGEAAELAAPNTTVRPKSTTETEEPVDIEGREEKTVTVARGDTLVKILQRMGAEVWQARAMADAARPVFPDNALMAGQSVLVTLVPSLTRANRMEPTRFSVYSQDQHKVSVTRNAAGEFIASAVSLDSRAAEARLGDRDEAPVSVSLYGGLYHAALTQGLSPETILQVMRIHVYETDFRRRIRNGDTIEQFFEVREEAGPHSSLGELLFTSIVSGGEIYRFWRFRTPDGIVDYYDESGHNSKKFLMRKPVRGESVRLTSGYGERMHPVFNVSRMHFGVDWAAPIGTPILAAGTGVIEEADRKGQYGNYVRVRHANGYHTAYGHMDRFGPGIRVGAKVRQGQFIGFVGKSGVASGPHLHYEVLVNGRFIDPSKLESPRERRLVGRQLYDFQKERARIDALMHSAPVMTASR